MKQISFLILGGFYFGIQSCTSLLFLDGTNKTEKLLEASDSDYPEDLRIKYQKEYRRNKLDISSGFTNLKTQASDSHVRDFIEKLKERREATKNSSSVINDEALKDDK